MSAKPPPLSAIPSTLRIPLAARTQIGILFPLMAVNDRYAANALARMGDEGQQWMRDRKIVYGTLGRTRRFRDQAQELVAHHPDAHVSNLGCGLSDQLRWIDNGRMTMTDTDLPQVRPSVVKSSLRGISAIRWLNLTDRPGLVGAAVPADQPGRSASFPDERRRVHVPRTGHGQCCTCQLWRTFPGRLHPHFRCDVLDGSGCAKHHTSVKHTDAEFHWGPRGLGDLTAQHPHLAEQAVHQVMDD